MSKDNTKKRADFSIYACIIHIKCLSLLNNHLNKTLMQKGNYKLGYHHDWDSNVLLPAMYRIEADI